MEDGAFEGVRVVELAQWVFVPVAGALLADWGADVIRIERPEGDPYRGLATQGIGTDSGGVNMSVALANRGKRSIALDLQKEEGRTVLHQLLETADVFLTNFRPGALRRLGLDAATLTQRYPQLVYRVGTGTACGAPMPTTPATTRRRSGPAAGWRTSSPRRTATSPSASGARWVTATARWRWRSGWRRHCSSAPARTGLGRRRVAARCGHVDAVVGRALRAPGPAAARDVGRRCVRESARRRPTGTKDDRHISLVFLEADRYWADFCGLLDRQDLADDPRFVDLQARREHAEECVAELEAEFASRTFAEWKTLLAQIDAPWAPVQAVEELLDDPQVLANEYIGDVMIDGEPAYRLPTVPVQFDEQPPALRRAPEHGEHSELLLLELGYTWEQIGELQAAGAIP